MLLLVICLTWHFLFVQNLLIFTKSVRQLQWESFHPVGIKVQAKQDELLDIYSVYGVKAAIYLL